MPAAAQAWIMDVVGKQLRNLTPSCFKMVAIASTIFMGCPPYLGQSRWPHVAEEFLLRPGLSQGPCGDYRRRSPWSRGSADALQHSARSHGLPSFLTSPVPPATP